MQYYVTERLSENMGKTPEGFLLCRDVPVARTGIQVYGKDEVPPDLEPDGDGTIIIERNADEVFHPDMLASLDGKPLANEHPEEDGERIDVTPDNFRKLVAGWVMRPRRGEGIGDNLLFADLLVADPDTIDDIVSRRKRELSAGYEAEYKSLGKGRAAQSKIRANHVALVESGRCGPLCKIRDDIPLVRPSIIAARRPRPRHYVIHGAW
jgi:hypothetical protein